MQRARVYVSGASRGIGRALAAGVPFDAEVVDISRSGTDLPGVRHLPADLASPEGWDTIGDALDRELAGFDGDRVVFVHNAGTIEPIGFAGESPTADYVANVLLNGAAPQVLGHRFLAAVRGLDVRRELVVITSGAASGVYPGWSSYGAGKAAVDQWVRTVGAEQGRRGGVRVCAIAPGVVASHMQETIREQSEDRFPPVGRFRRLHREGGLADPTDVARRLWQVLEDGVEPGAVLDLRDLGDD